MYERRSILLKTPSYRQETVTHIMRFVIANYEGNLESSKKRSATLLTFLFLTSSTASIHFSAFEASATNNDQDADGLPYGIEFIINTQPQDWDSDNDGLPDGWEWQYGLDPLSSLGDNLSLIHI